MILVSGLVTAFGRLVGAVATRTLGWATILLFGQVPRSRQTLLSVISLASLLWLFALVAALIPTLDELLASALPHPASVQASWFRAAMVVTTLLLPLAVGIATVGLTEDADDREERRRRVVGVARGYPYTAVLAITIVFLALWALVRKIRALRRAWQSVHLPMIVKAGRYDAVVADVGASLHEARLDVVERPASWWFAVPPQLLAAVGGQAVRRLVPDRLVGFEMDDLGVLVYPSDVAIVGQQDLVARARAAVARRLTFADAYLTTGKESEQIEDRLREISRMPGVDVAGLQAVDAMLTSLPVPYDEWETLYRLRLQVELEARRPTETRRMGAA